MTRKRARKEDKQFDPLCLVPVVDDGDTLRLEEEDNFPSFGLIGTESVLGKMGSILSLASQPSVATTAALVPLVSSIGEKSSDIPQIRSNELVVGIASRCLIETNVESLRLSRVRSAGTRWLQMHVFPTSNLGRIESLWEAYQSFVNELVFPLDSGSSNYPRWGLVEIPRLGTLSEWVYVEEKEGGQIQLVATVGSDKSFLDSLKTFGVNFEVVEKSRDGDEKAEESDEDDENENLGFIKIIDRVNIFGFFDFLRSNLILKLINLSKSGSRNRWPLFTTNCAFRHSCVISPSIWVRRGTETTRFVEIESINCPIIFLEKYLFEIGGNNICVKVTVKEKQLFELFNGIRLAPTSQLVELITE